MHNTSHRERRSDRWTNKTLLSPTTPHLRRKRYFLRCWEARYRSPSSRKFHPHNVNSHWRMPPHSSPGTSHEKFCLRNIANCSMSRSSNSLLQELIICHLQTCPRI